MALRPYHAKVSELPREYRFEGQYSRTGFISENALFSFVWLKNFQWNDDVPPDRHPFDQWMFFVEGVMEMVLWEEDVYRCEAGDVLYIPRDVSHRARMVNDEDILILEVFSPIRPDYLYIAEHQTADDAPPRREDGSRVEERGLRYVNTVLTDPAYRDSGYAPANR
jgi:mannose-6-phosphate isomerase-like protein (cupin superfamily)